VKTNLRFPFWGIWIFFLGSFALLLAFSGGWYVRYNKLNQLDRQESDLRSQIDQLECWGKWTLEYVKIEKSIDYLSKNKLSQESRRKLTDQIWQISRSYSIDPLMILAVVAQESHGNPNARGKMRSGAESGAMGLMQIKLETAQKMARFFGLRVETAEDLLKPEINVSVGTAYLIRLIGKYGNWKDALIAYNLGHSAVDNMLEKGKPLPTRYYEHVISKYRDLADLSFM